jgi:hypothetical protein
LIEEALRVWLDSGEYSSPEGRLSNISWIAVLANFRAGPDTRAGIDPR